MSKPASEILGRGAAILACLALGVLLAAAAGEAESEVDPLAALHEGNRLFRGGQLEEAVETYRGGYDPGAPHPTLVYNLGTALHHLDRLPEAILWYRRARGSDDPWLEENLWLARRTLGSQALPAGGPFGWLARHGDALRWIAVALAWIALVLWIAAPRVPPWSLASAGLLALGLYGAAFAGERWGPHPAVLLEDCRSASGELPAGTEVWVRRGDAEGWRVSAGATRVACPADSLELVFPEG